MNNLENFGVQELSVKEQQATEGGLLLWILLGSVGIAGYMLAKKIFD